MSTIFFHPKRQSYYHRSIVPRRLQAYLNGREQVWRSLKTDDRDEAKLRSAHWDTRVQRVFTTLKKYGERMTQDEREALVAHWLEVELEEAEDHRAICGPVSDAHRESQIDGISIMFDEANEALMSCDYRKIEKEADDLLKAAGQSPSSLEDSGYLLHARLGA